MFGFLSHNRSWTEFLGVKKTNNKDMHMYSQFYMLTVRSGYILLSLSVILALSEDENTQER